ncbi:hypothetical protein DB88DRAFT_191822 [Papiliotrema laurentii]|uniref:Cytochrome b561 domain-containing protein n=1 Tax=Papiliotrema laurentii TaxID=5418 RepID=A0AAD9FSM1_PAPLA|nr:hypothetical protein DB88DRAFT_191822 [Papiliotrema laurentii]
MRIYLAVMVVAGWAAVTHGLITGSQRCNKNICVTGLHDDQAKTDTYTLAPPKGKTIPSDQFGWMSIGFGNKMAGSPMIIVWPNSDGTVTLSQRSAPGNVEPSITSNPARTASLVAASTFANSTSTSITFTLPSDSGASATSLNQTQLIWAYSKNNPGSSQNTAGIVQHDSAGTMTLPLLATWNPQSSNSTSSSGNSGSSDSGDSGDSGSSSKTALLAHAICGSLAVLLFLPIGTLVPRIARGFSLHRWWFPTHGIVNGVIGSLLVAAAFIISKVSFDGGDGGGSSHPALGTILFIAIIAQVALGIFVHWYKSSFHRFQTKSGRGPSNFIHMVLGVAIVIVGWATAWTGIDDEWPQFYAPGNVVWYKVILGVVIGVTGLSYLAGLAFLLPRQIRMERQARSQRESQYQLDKRAQRSDEIEMADTRSD